MMNFLKTTTCLGGVALLAACGGGSDVGDGGGGGIVISAEEEALRVFADTDGDGVGDQDIADVLDGDGTLTARQVSEASYRQTFGTDTYDSIDGEVQFAGDGDDLLVTFSIAGDPAPTTVRIVDARSIEDNFIELETDDYFFNFFVGNGLSIGDLLDSTMGAGYAARVGVYFDDLSVNSSLQSDLIIGTETTDMMISQLGVDNAVASYSGFANINIREQGSNWSAFNARINGDLNMDADFAAGTISGDVSSLFYEERAGNDVTDSFEVDGSLIMESTSIDANAFGGILSADALLTADDAGIAAVAGGVGYSGAFYGPEAEEIGGTFAGSESFEGQDYIAIGSFSGNIDD